MNRGILFIYSQYLFHNILSQFVFMFRSCSHDITDHKYHQTPTKNELVRNLAEAFFLPIRQSLTPCLDQFFDKLIFAAHFTHDNKANAK